MAKLSHIAVIGFGEAGRTFASAGGWEQRAAVYDRLTDRPETAAAKQAEYVACHVSGCAALSQAAEGAETVISLVTADQALGVAQATADVIGRGGLYLDFNSVAPSTKQAGAAAIDAAGAHYVDVAVMSPVQPAALRVPLLLSGAKAAQAAERLSDIGFTNVRIVEGPVGRASSIKMIRSVMVKGLEALTAECVLAASKAGVLDEVLSSLDASWSEASWAERAHYNLDRMMIHGSRRAAEMAEVVRTLEDLGTGAAMSSGTVKRQAEVGALGLKQPPESLEEKIASVLLRGERNK